MALFIQGGFTILQRTAWPSKVWQQTSWWSHSYSMALWSLRALPGMSQLQPNHVICCAASAAEAAAKHKDDQLTQIACNYYFFPIAFETSCPIN